MDYELRKSGTGWPRKYEVLCKYCKNITKTARKDKEKVCFDCQVKRNIETSARYRKLHPFKSKKKN